METSSKDELDDDYVAQLLAQDAKKTSQRYASQGLPAFLPTRRAAHLPKPNTRFLSHIVREADSHNASLKRKEEHEAERRLKLLREKGHEPLRKRRRADESDVSRRNRMLGDIVSAAKSISSDRNRVSDDKHVSRQDHGRATHREKDRKHRRSSRSRSRSRSPSYERNSHRRSRKSHRSRRSRTRSPDSDHGRDVRKDSHLRSAVAENSKQSDPTISLSLQQRSHTQVDDAISRSPLPSDTPVRVRGRGANARRSGIDNHFAEDYDPSQDAFKDGDSSSDIEDWDLALEAMRDRAKYRQSQAARMREAGFEEKDISAWEKGFSNADAADKDIKAMKWSRQGEVREWDAGKVNQ